MNKFYFFIFVAIVSIANIADANATIWRVNNNPGKSGTFEVIPGEVVIVFSNLTDALRSSDVQAGDTLHIEGSTIPYGKNNGSATSFDVDTVRKRLVIIGPGYLLSENAETQHNKESAKIYSLFISSAATGTVIAGLEQMPSNLSPTQLGGTPINGVVYAVNPFYDEAVAGSYLTANSYAGVNSQGTLAAAQAMCWNQPNKYKILVNADNVTITHCKLYYLELYNDRALQNITITKCFFNPGIIACRADDKPVTNLIISNSFFRNDGKCAYSGLNDATTNATVGVYGQVRATSFMAIDLRGKINSVGAVANEDMYVYYNRYSWPVVTPTIQNNTFYNSFNISVKSARLSNNLFFPKQVPVSEANARLCYGLPVWAGTAEHTTSNNIIFNLSVWPTPSASVNYGGMYNNDSYSNIAETSWFTSSTTLPALDKSFIIGNSSPARSSDGVETKQRGMYGGLSPYALSGLYTIPAVWEITIPSYPSGEVPSTGFEVRVRVRSH